MELKDVENLAELARIELSEDEKKTLLKDFDSILGYIQNIEKVELEDTEQEFELRNVWRKDHPPAGGEPREFSRDLLTGQFPDSQDGFLKVKKIM